MLHEVLLDTLELPHLVNHIVYALSSLLLFLCVLNRNGFLLLSLRQGFVLDELALVLSDLKGSITFLFKIGVAHEHTFVVAFFLFFNNQLFGSLVHSQYVYIVATLFLDSYLVLSQITKSFLIFFNLPQFLQPDFLFKLALMAVTGIK